MWQGRHRPSAQRQQPQRVAGKVPVQQTKLPRWLHPGKQWWCRPCAQLQRQPCLLNPCLWLRRLLSVFRAEGSADTKMASWCAMLDARLSHKRGGHLCKSRRVRHWEASEAQDLSLHQASFPGPLPDPSCMLLRCTHYMWRQWQENQPVHVRCPGRQMGGPAPAHHGLDDYVLVVCSMVVKKPSTHSPPLAGLLGAWRAHRGRVSSVHRDHSHTHTHRHCTQHRTTHTQHHITHRHTHAHTPYKTRHTNQQSVAATSWLPSA